MLKGHVQIDLHNHKTGLKDRIEQDNLITNAPQIISNTMIGRNKGASFVMPMVKTILGGILLFEDPLTENANNIYFPGNNILTGFGGQVLNTSDEQLGSINNIETGPTENGYDCVWEFNTSQANGYISSLALTHANVADSLPQMAISTDIVDLGSGSTQAGVYRENSDHAVYFRSNVLYNTRIPTKNYAIYDTYNYTGTPEVITPASTTTRDHWLNSLYGMDGYMYRFGFGEASHNTYYTISAFTVYRAALADLSEDTWTSKTFEIPSSQIVVPDAARNNYNPTAPSSLFTPASRRVVVSNGYIYYLLNDSENGRAIVWIFDFANLSADFVNISYSDFSTTTSYDPMMFPLRGGGCMLALRRLSNTNYRYLIQIKPNKEYKIYSREISNNGQLYPALVFDDLTCLRRTNNTTLSLSAGYLGSIANLENPFEKTNTVSMKVKYSLTQV